MADVVGKDDGRPAGFGEGWVVLLVDVCFFRSIFRSFNASSKTTTARSIGQSIDLLS